MTAEYSMQQPRKRCSVNFTCDYSAICCQQGGTDTEVAVGAVSHTPDLQAFGNQLFNYICAWKSSTWQLTYGT